MRTLLARIVWTLLLCAACAAVRAQPLQGREFLALDPPRPVATGSQIEVIEFFYYGCPICYESQPHIARWLMRTGGDVVLRRVPATTAEGGESFALTFYALEATGLLARLHWPVYDNHHFDNMRLHQEKNLLEWLGRNGVDAERFRQVRDSADVKAKVDAGQKLYESYNVRAVPTFAVDGRFLTSSRMAGGVQEMMRVVEHLVGRAREERRKR
ncbi:MAG: thiol:disulfide interchange protein DsbA/DsbL [Burkholderiales bacterium]